MKDIRCLLTFHKWETTYDPNTDDPVRGCLRCDKIQIYSASHELFFWHDSAKGWTYSMWKRFNKAVTHEEKLSALTPREKKN